MHAQRAVKGDLNATALAVMVQSLPKSSCAGFSHPPLWWFPQAYASFQKKKERKKEKEKKEKRKAQVSNFLCPPNKPQGGL